METTKSEDKKIVVIGAGLAGLSCTRILQRAGLNAHLYEASEGVGGRVRTDIVEGFRLDRGFQVLFTAYPALRKEIDLTRLDIRAFDPGATVIWNGSIYPVGDPIRMPKQFFSTAFSGLMSFGDKLKLLKLRKLVKSLDITDIFLLPDQNIYEYLRDFGFSDAFIDNFIRPFFSGIFLERGLATSARLFAFVFKMMTTGDTVVPASGMNAIPRQIADDIAQGTIHLKSPVIAINRTGADGAVTGIALEGGEVVAADVAVVATSADIAALLTGLPLPQEKRSSTCLYFEIPNAFINSKSIMLFADPNKYAGANAFVNNAMIMTNVSSEYAPAGKFLLSVTAIGEPRLTDEQMAAVVRREIGSHFPKSLPEQWRLLRVYRIPWSQYSQTVGVSRRLPKAETTIPGLILSGEIISTSSINGALEAGQKSANAVLYMTGEKVKRDRTSTR